MKVKPVGYRILVRPDPVEEVSKGGIIISVGEQKKMEQAAQVRGTVLALGELAYQESREKGYEPWCKVGDKVTYQKWAGMRIPDREGNLRDDLLLLNDTDVTSVITEEDE
jgi:chaperonin GroES